MIVTTINKEQIFSVSLPQKAAGQYWLHDGINNEKNRLISIEGINNEWVMKSNRHVKIVDSAGGFIKSVVIKPMSIFALQKNDTEKIVVYVEPVSEDRQTFEKYMVMNDADISIGRSEDNDICFNYQPVSTHHATLYHRSGQWVIKDEQSTNGTFVNEKRISESILEPGDTITVMGLKIIIGKNFIALNNPGGVIRISSVFSRFVKQNAEPYDDEDEYEPNETEYFYRSPRFMREIKTATFKIDPPPQSPISEEMPWLLVMGSSMAMGMMSVVTLFSAIATSNMTSMIMGISMLIGTLILPLITKSYERRHKRNKEALRQQRYRNYLQKTDAQIKEACLLQEEILNENNPSIVTCEKRITESNRNLWERTPWHSDFLRTRVGHGTGELDAELLYQEKKFSIDNDVLLDEMHYLCEKPKELSNIPITYSLFDDHISGIIGDRNLVKNFTRGLIIQLSALYSYDEVKFVFLYDKQEEEAFGFVKWLPHVWNDDNKFRFVATNSGEVKEISAYMEGIISSRAELNESEIEKVSPYFIIFSMSKDLANRAEMIKQVLAKKENIHISIVTIYEELRQLPKECSMVVEITEHGGRLFDKDDITRQSVQFIPDIYPTEDPKELSIKLLNTHLNTAAASFKLPKMITFLEMFGVGKVEHLNAPERWKENDPTKSLEAAVGVDTLGEIFKLDLHEKFHGPHGLVAGMTGSGKSEFIITYILSMAVNYHPNEVAFILIDYKGGGMAKSFENLPHVAGIITNLDGSSIKRSLLSIESELKRRQAIFAEASKKVGVSNIDIYKYQKLFREGTVSEPLQHLFIISDEFAELKTQQVEFMEQLVSAARIGRSLGIHLILATQKPSGVVDDQIWSNSKFRVCLKVQERADSMDMLKRPDAAELTDTGRFYLQVGYNELFELGQSAWAGAPYFPSEKVQKEKDDSITVIDINGHPIKEVKPVRRNAYSSNAKKQLDAITEYLSVTAKEEGIKIKPLWLEPIPAVIFIEDLKNKYNVKAEPFVLDPVIGEYDDPAHQRQNILRLPISAEGNAVVYGVAGSGKTTFLNAMLYSLLHEHSPEEVNIYILDFASETLRAFAGAPHVGDVILSYEAEKVDNLFKMLHKEAEKRKKLFADYGGDYSSYLKASERKLPSIVVAINNFTAFTEIYEEKEDAILFLSREGTKYGIYFVLTAIGVNGVKFRLLQNFKQLLVLQLNDESDYSTVVGKTNGLLPSKFKGRGLVKTDDLYEFQIASLTDDDVPISFIQSECAKLNHLWNGTRAPKVPILPDVVNADFLKNYITADKGMSVPIGVESHSLNVHFYPFANRYINLVMSAESEYQSFIANISTLIGQYINTAGVVFDVPKTVTENIGKLKLVSSAKECEAAINDLFDIVLYRNNTYKEAADSGSDCETFEQTTIIINSLSSLKNSLSDNANEKLSLLLEKGSVNYQMTIIIGEQVKNISLETFEKWYKLNASASDGIWIGNGISEQYQMKANKTTKDMHEDIGTDFGFSLIKGRCTKIKLLNSGEKDDEYDDQ